MSDIADFLRARYAEQRALAEAATPGPWEGVVDRHQRGVVDASVWADSIGYYITENISSGERHEADARHIAANDPADVIADLNAKLALVDEHAPGGHYWPGSSRRYCKTCGSGEPNEYPTDWPCRTLRLLARPFVGHRDHKGEEWTP